MIWRGEKDNVTTAGDPHEMWFRFSGRQIGYVGNNGTQDVDYATSVAYRVATQGTNAFFNGQHSAPLHADWDLAYDSTNSYTQGSQRGMYVVQAGDTLSSIAAAIWGDASLWWKLAEVNGLTAESTLPEGLPLIIPAGVIVHHNNALTYQPYDPLEVLGSTSPTAPKPARAGQNCGGGQVFLVIIAIVVSIYTAGAASGAIAGMMSGMGASAGAAAGAGLGVAAAATAAGATGAAAGVAAVAGAAIGGAVGSIVSQGIGVATGIQDKFSWNAVALAAIGSAVGASGLGSGAARAIGAVKGMTHNVVSAMAGNAITQGLGIAVGAQSKFSWAGVAAAGIGAAVFDIASARLPGAARTEWYAGPKGPYGVRVEATSLNQHMSSMAQDIADAGARTLMEGSDFGDNMLVALPNVIGKAIGGAIAGGISKRIQKARTERQERERWQEQIQDEKIRLAYDDLRGGDSSESLGLLHATQYAPTWRGPIGRLGDALPSGVQEALPRERAYPEDALVAPTWQMEPVDLRPIGDWEGLTEPVLSNMIRRADWNDFVPVGEARRSMFRNYRQLDTITGVVFHDTGFERTRDGVFNDHMARFDDIGYHYMIERDGRVVQGRSLYFEGAHVSGYNDGTIGIAFVGQYSVMQLTSEQLASAEVLVRALDHATGNRLAVSTHPELAGRAWDQRPIELFGVQAQIEGLRTGRPEIPFRPKSGGDGW